MVALGVVRLPEHQRCGLGTTVRRYLAAAGAFALLATAAPSFAQGGGDVQSKAMLSAGGVRTVAIYVESDHCVSCAFQIRRAVSGLPGVASVRQGSSRKHLVVTYSTEQLTAVQIVDAIRKAGFNARIDSEVAPTAHDASTWRVQTNPAGWPTRKQSAAR